MAAQIVLAALAALCCVQGLSAAAVLPPVTAVASPAVWADEFTGVAELATLVKALETEVLLADAENTELTKAKKNIITCVQSLYGVYKTLKAATDMVGDYKQVKKTLEEELQTCQTLEQQEEQSKCVEVANTKAQTELSAIKGQVPAMLLAVGTSLWSLKSCASIV